MMDRNYERFVEAVEACSQMAQRDIEEFIGGLDLSKKKASRDAILLVVPSIVEKYGDMAAAAACEYYEQERHRQIGGTYHTRVHPMKEEDRQALLESIRYACGYLFDDPEEDDG